LDLLSDKNYILKHKKKPKILNLPFFNL